MASKKRVKPGTKKLINGKKMVMGFNGRWVSQVVFNRQKQAREANKIRASRNVPGERTRIRPKPVPRGSQGRQLEGSGKTSALTAKARYQRGLRRDKLAREQLSNFGKSFRKVVRQRTAQNKLDNAAKGTKGNKVRYNAGDSARKSKALPPGKKGGPIRAKGGPLAKTTKTSSQITEPIRRVKVKVDPPAPGGSIVRDKNQKVNVKVDKPTPKRPGTTKNEKPSQPTRRQQAQAKLDRAKAGSRSSTVRTGQAAPGTNPIGISSTEKKVLKQLRGKVGGEGLFSILNFALKIADGQDPGSAAFDTAGGYAGAVAGARIGARGGPIGAGVGAILGGIGGDRLAQGIRGLKGGQGRVGASNPVQGRQQQPQGTGSSNIPPEEGPYMNPQFGQPGNFNNPSLQVPIQPVANPAAASQTAIAPASPRPLPQTPGSGPSRTMSTAPRTETPTPKRQRPTNLKDGLAMWEEIHKNSQKSVIDGLNIVERYRQKLGAS